MRFDLNEDDISWVCDGEKITVSGDYIDAVYDNKLDRVTALEFSSVSFFIKKELCFSLLILYLTYLVPVYIAWQTNLFMKQK